LVLEMLLTPRPVLTEPRDRYVYYAGLADIPESQAVNLCNRSHAMGALVDLAEPGSNGATGSSRVLCAQGARFKATPSTSRTTDFTMSTG
jgi:hypothetical protein